MNNKKNNKFIYLIFLLILLIISLSFFIYCKYFNINQQDNNNKEYINSEYNFSIILPSGWRVEEAPVYDNDAKNLFFYSADSTVSFNIVINELPQKFENIQEYSNYLIQKNIDNYNEGQAPYKWEYKKLYFKNWPYVDVYIFEEIKSPAGYEDLIIVISDKYSYNITYSELNNEGIRIVDENYRQEVKEILHNFKNLSTTIEYFPYSK